MSDRMFGRKRRSQIRIVDLLDAARDILIAETDGLAGDAEAPRSLIRDASDWSWRTQPAI